MSSGVSVQEVLKFWFEECTPPQWFVKDAAFDERMASRFGETITQGLAGELEGWAETREGCVALILVLDQFTRNVYRDTPKAFAGDEKALAISTLCQERGYLDFPDRRWCHFMLIPMMHSEDIQVQEASLPLFETHTNEQVYGYAIRHRDIIARFGRYPHRNKIIGRSSTEEELSFLTEPGSSF